MRLSLVPRLLQICTLCEQSVEDHAENCPHRFTQYWVNRKLVIKCPECGGSVDINTDDFYECRKCHTQYSHSSLYGEDKGVVLLDFKNDKTIPCHTLKEKGRGQITVDIELAKAEKRVKQALRKKKK